MSKLSEIKGRLERATPGNWRAVRAPSSICIGSDTDIIESLEDLKNSMHVESMGENSENNAIFIAHAPRSISYLLNLVERMKEIVEQIHYNIGSVDREVTDDILKELEETI